jgi:hypothetical protein
LPRRPSSSTRISCIRRWVKRLSRHRSRARAGHSPGFAGQ